MVLRLCPSRAFHRGRSRRFNFLCWYWVPIGLLANGIYFWFHWILSELAIRNLPLLWGMQP